MIVAPATPAGILKMMKSRGIFNYELLYQDINQGLYRSIYHVDDIDCIEINIKIDGILRYNKGFNWLHLKDKKYINFILKLVCVDYKNYSWNQVHYQIDWSKSDLINKQIHINFWFVVSENVNFVEN